MSIVKVSSVFCDGRFVTGAPCPKWVGEGTTDEARREARREGWTRIDGGDRCPACTRRAEGKVPCACCDGSGKTSGYTCPVCNGTGAQRPPTTPRTP